MGVDQYVFKVSFKIITYDSDTRSRMIKAILAYPTRPGFIDATRALIAQESKALQEEIKFGPSARTISTEGKALINTFEKWAYQQQFPQRSSSRETSGRDEFVT